MTAMTVSEARERNALGTATGGCWRCIQDAKRIGRAGSYEKEYAPKEAKTQWLVKDLRFIGHRQFCPDHYREELRGERDF